jgi:hypothetical protein
LQLEREATALREQLEEQKRLEESIRRKQEADELLAKQLAEENRRREAEQRKKEDEEKRKREEEEARKEAERIQKEKEERLRRVHSRSFH